MTELSDLAQQTDLLLRTARRIDQVGAPSLCVGWTRGHVLSHIARNADGLRRLVRHAVDGTGEPMYDSSDKRDADIDAGAGRALDVLVADVADTAQALLTDLRRLTPEVAQVEVPRTPGGMTFRAGFLPAMRLREVVFHHVDLDAGFTFADLEPALLQQLLLDQVRRLEADPQTPPMRLTTHEGEVWQIGHGGPTVTGHRGAMLLWLARQIDDGVVGDPELPDLPAGV